VLKKIAATGVLALAFGGAALAGAAPASAGGPTDNSGVLNGNEVNVTVCGSSVQVLTVLAEAVGVCAESGQPYHH
jgi:hypothetical protein